MERKRREEAEAARIEAQNRLAAVRGGLLTCPAPSEQVRESLRDGEGGVEWAAEAAGCPVERIEAFVQGESLPLETFDRLCLSLPRLLVEFEPAVLHGLE
jgi:hypothetical protein